MQSQPSGNLAHLNAAQREAVLHGDTPLLVLAGAGTGKTSVITQRIAHMVQTRGIAPWRILAVTFTNKAAREMRTRAERLLAPQDIAAAPDGQAQPNSGLEVGTFHRLCGRMLRQYPERVGLTRSFVIYDADEQLTLVKRCCQELNIDTQAHTPRALRAAIEGWKNVGQSPAEAAAGTGANTPTQDKARQVYARYQQRLKEANALDFSDMLRQAVVLLQEHPDVRQSYRARWSHLLVDEYQDTNPVQYAWLKYLVTEQHSLTVVGDDDQSIYRWRGADIGNILRFERDFPGAHVVRLEQNYRSTSTILAAANGVIGHNAARKGKTLYSQLGEGAPVAFWQFDTERDEGLHVAGSIAARLAANTPASEVAILYRTNAQSRPLEDALRRSRIPYVMVGGTRFYDRKEVKDALSYLRLLCNPHSTLDFLRVVNVPARSLGKTSLDKLAVAAESAGEGLLATAQRLGGNLQLARAAGLSPRATKALASFAGLLAAGTQAMDGGAGLGELLGHTLQDAGYLTMLQQEGTDEAQERLQNLQELGSAMDEYQASANAPSLAGFLEEVSLATDVDRLEEGQSSVVLMTLHAAKGLEFGHVYLPGMEENLFPHARCLDDRAALEEERRLCYVGLTRAKETLTLSAARVRSIFGQPQLSQVSRFVAEIPSALLSAEAHTALVAGGVGAGQLQTDTWQAAEDARGARSAWRPDRAKTAPKLPLPPHGPAGTVPAAGAAGAFAPGSQVMHATFGQGAVLAQDGSGARTKLTIDFPGWGRKTVVARFVTPAPEA